MKTLNLLLCIIFLSSTGFTPDLCNGQPVSVLSRKRDIFYFKICKEFLGARIDVYSPEGELLGTDEIIRQKALVDFFFEKPGKYQIKFTKDDQEKIFTYTKTTPPPLVVADYDYQIVIAQ